MHSILIKLKCYQKYVDPFLSHFQVSISFSVHSSLEIVADLKKKKEKKGAISKCEKLQARFYLIRA